MRATAVSAGSSIARRLFADSRVRNWSFAALFALYAYAQVVGYRHTYPTAADRREFALTFGVNKALQLFYGIPHDLITVGGYTAWRFGGIGAIIASVWAVLASVKAYRGEEDAGRQELVLAGIVARRTAFAAAAVSICAGAALLWLAIFVALVAGHLSADGSAYLALATISPVPVFAGAGALASQLASTRRLALQLAIGAVLLAFVLRVIADIGDVGALRWATPLGWAEEMRAFAGPRPLVLGLPLLAGVLLFLVAALFSGRRDVGSGVLASRDTSPPRLWGLSSPAAFAFRSELGTYVSWLVGTAVFALVVGVLSTSFSAKTISKSLQDELAKLGGASIVTPAGALSFYFLFFVLAISLFACSQIGAARREEADQQLEMVLAQPVGRRRWLGGRLGLAAAGCAVIGLAAGLLAWVGAAAQGAGVSLPDLLGAGLNTLPTALLFLGLGALAYALLPRAGAAVAYALVLVSFLWELLAALLGAPRWLLDATPFQHIGLVPAQPFRAAAAATMLAIGAASALAALAAFRRRDLVGA
jgi:ABC-2 type transport system permease protein